MCNRHAPFCYFTGIEVYWLWRRSFSFTQLSFHIATQTVVATKWLIDTDCMFERLDDFHFGIINVAYQRSLQHSGSGLLHGKDECKWVQIELPHHLVSSRSSHSLQTVVHLREYYFEGISLLDHQINLCKRSLPFEWQNAEFVRFINERIFISMNLSPETFSQNSH